MIRILHCFYKFSLLFTSILLSGCLSNINLAYSSAELSVPYGSDQQSPSYYLEHAQLYHDARKQDYELLALDAYLTRGQLSAAHTLSLKIQAQNTKQMEEKRILLAQLSLLQQQPTQTIQILSTIRTLRNLDIYHQCKYHELLSLAYQKLEQYSEAAKQRIKLDSLLSEPQILTSNRQKLWGLIQDIPTAELNAQLLEAEQGSIWRGWLSLALIIRQQKFDQQWEQWATHYPNHPAMNIIKKPKHWFFIRPKTAPEIHKIAVLLPLSGPLAGPGAAIKQGFLDAYQHSGQHLDLTFYDSHRGAVTEYHRAIDEGANIVVGPLTKSDASAVAATLTSTPTLLLNDFGFSLSSSKYAFGYSPKDESVQLAKIMHQKSYHHIMMIIPNNPWGQEVSRAFRNQAEQDGMDITSTIYYNNGQNIGQQIRQTLHYQEHKAITAQGKKTLISSRRQDLDAIFMLAYPSMARQIIPLLKYYYAGDLPVYASSASYAAHYNPNSDKDLDGMYFIDIPWVFNHQIGYKNWPESWNTYSRLYALGYDAFDLTQEWQTLQSMPQSGLTKQTGTLYVMPGGHIRRELTLAQIQQGVAKELFWQ